jgi:hypothetical protein
MQLKRVFSLLLLFSIPILLYQNCGQEVSLVSPKPSNDVFFRMGGSFCPSVDAINNYSLQEFYILNLTARASRYNGQFLADSDIDGISDVEELQYGFDPVVRRTNGILDSICLDAGATNCDQVVLGDFLTFGLMTSDLESVQSPGVIGFDQDEDHIPDFVEILFGTLINQADGDVSSDDINDGKSNITEIKMGLAPRSILDRGVSETYHTKVINQRLDSSVICANGQPGYSFRLQQLPLLDTLAFTSLDEPYLNHAAGDNLIMFLVVSVTAGGVQEISYALKNVNVSNQQVEVEVTPNDFKNINQF